MFISHARTPEEFKAEVCSHIRQRIVSNDGYAKNISKNAAEKTRLAAVSNELENLFQFFTDMEIIRPKRNRSPGPSAIAPANTQGIQNEKDPNANDATLGWEPGKLDTFGPGMGHKATDRLS